MRHETPATQLLTLHATSYAPDEIVGCRLRQSPQRAGQSERLSDPSWRSSSVDE